MFLIAAASFLIGCGGGGPDDPVSASQHALFLTGAVWPLNGNGAHTVPVCFTPLSTVRGDFAQIVARIRISLRSTWESHANLRFTEFTTCPVNNNGAGKVRVSIVASLDVRNEGQPTVGYQGASNPVDVRLGGDMTNAAIVHTFGHALGFAEEGSRPDWHFTCDKPDLAGNTLGTPATTDSIMNGCNWKIPFSGLDQFTDWDTAAAQIAYGRKLPGSLVAPDGRCLDVPYARFEDHNTPTLYDCQGGANQNWTHQVENDSLSVTGDGVTKCLDVPGWNNTNGTSPNLYGCNGQGNQQWAFKSVAIQSYFNDCLTGTSADNVASPTPCLFDSAQRWTFTSTGEIRTGDGGSGSRCLTGTSTTNVRYGVDLQPCTGQESQHFVLAPGGQLRVSNKCLARAESMVQDCGGPTPIQQLWSTVGSPIILDKCLTPPINGGPPALDDCHNLQTTTDQRWQYYW